MGSAEGSGLSRQHYASRSWWEELALHRVVFSYSTKRSDKRYSLGLRLRLRNSHVSVVQSVASVNGLPLNKDEIVPLPILPPCAPVPCPPPVNRLETTSDLRKRGLASSPASERHWPPQRWYRMRSTHFMSRMGKATWRNDFKADVRIGKSF